LLMPNYLAEIAEVNGAGVDALWRHNPDATFTSRGCIRKCEFCAVPKIEGDLVELDEWEPKPIVCDNNLLACSKAHFDTVIDRLKGIERVDFQGLDARVLTEYHAARLTELDLGVIRVAWDETATEKSTWRGIYRLLGAGIPKRRVRVYVLIGFRDDPADALYRLERIRGAGLLPCPQRYNPLKAMSRDSHVGSGWMDSELTRFMRYWYSPRVWGVPFEEWI